MNRSILVTGGAGFIGSHLVDYFLSQYPGDQVICLDKLTYAGKLQNLTGAMQCGRFRFVQGDICDPSAVNVLFAEERPDLVVNLAAETHVDHSIENPSVFLATNVMGTQVLMDACLRFHIPRFHQVSTDEVYGDLPLDRPELLFREDSPLNPSSPYSASKAGADLLVLSYVRTFGLKATITRCSNNFGPRQLPEKLLPLAIKKALLNEPIPLYGSGQNVRDWLFVTDHCRAIDCVLQRGTAGDVYNVGGSRELSNLQLLQKVCDFLGKPRSLITPVADRPGHDLRYGVSWEKLKQELHWEPICDFTEALKAYIAFESSK